MLLYVILNSIKTFLTDQMMPCVPWKIIFFSLNIYIYIYIYMWEGRIFDLKKKLSSLEMTLSFNPQGFAL